MAYGCGAASGVRSPPSRAAWIEITASRDVNGELASRRLHGRRGLKYDCIFERHSVSGRRLHGRRGLKSPKVGFKWKLICRRLHGRRGLKSRRRRLRPAKPSRRLHGRRGLKFRAVKSRMMSARLSPPSRAAWIEILTVAIAALRSVVAAFTGGVD